MSTPAGFVNLLAQNIRNAARQPLAAGTLEVRITDGNDHPIEASAGSCTLLADSPAILPITNGALPTDGTAIVPDTTATLPPNICLRLTVKDPDGAILSTRRRVQTVAGTDLNLDTYLPIPTGAVPAVVLAGTPGLSAYQQWLALGNTGTEQAFLASLAGPPGPATVVTSNGANGDFNIAGNTTAKTLRTNTTFINPKSAPNNNNAADPIAASLNKTAAGASWSLGNTGGWGGAALLTGALNCFRRGIKQTMGFFNTNYGEGDTAGLYSYVNSVGGPTAASDEGVVGASFETKEFAANLRGVIQTTTGQGDTAPVLDYTTLQGQNWLADGGKFLRIPSAGVVTGNMTGRGAQFSIAGARFVLYSLTTTASLPLTTAWGYVNPNAATDPSNANNDAGWAIPYSNANAATPVPVTVSVTLGAIPGQTTNPPFAVGDWLRLAGEAHSELVEVTAAGAVSGNTQSLTFATRYPNFSAYLFRGGIYDHFISFDASLALTHTLRTSYMAVGSFDGSTLIYVNNQLGRSDFQIPQLGTEAATIDGGARSGFHLYRGAENCATLDPTQPLVTLEPNNIPWAAGDAVECCLPSYFGGNGLKVLRYQNSPALAGYSSEGIYLQMSGPGVAAGTKGILVANYSDVTQYYDGGGPLQRPDAAFKILGPWLNTIEIDKGPDPTQNGAAIVINSGAATQWRVISLPLGPGIQFDPTTGRVHIDEFHSGDAELGATTATSLAVSGAFSAGTLTAATTLTVGLAGSQFTVGQFGDVTGHEFSSNYSMDSPHFGVNAGGRIDLNSSDGSSITAIRNGNIYVSGTAMRFQTDQAVTFDFAPTHPTPAAGDNSTKSATTAFVAAAIAGYSGALAVTTPTGTKTLTIANGLITGVA